MPKKRNDKAAAIYVIHLHEAWEDCTLRVAAIADLIADPAPVDNFSP